MADLFLELRSEEIPARMQDAARHALAAGMTDLLAKAGLACEAVGLRTYATPRRLALFVPGIPARQADRVVERRGPREDAPPAARDGFLKSLRGQDHEVSVREEAKGRVLVARITEPGRPTALLLADEIPQLLARFPWPKAMRWGAGEVRWVRPLHGILCLFGEESIPVVFAGVTAGVETTGHRVHGAAPVCIRDHGEYQERMRKAYVVVDPAERQSLIEGTATRLARAEGLELVPDEALLAEVTGLVEWPVPLLGRIDPEFMSLPPEVLVTTMRQHQKYLALRDRAGRLASRFIVVANLEATDGGRAIVAGNERVLRARLWDARFFWDQDRQTPLDQRLPALDRMVFHAALGTQGERVERLTGLGRDLARWVPGADAARVARAARLAKADLVTGLVGEFPELQGIMGGYYARLQGEDEVVASAIAEQYTPKGPGEACPVAPESMTLALADRLDQLAGFFAAKLRPTGSKDPFALRRAALGVIRIVLERQLRLPLREVIERALEGYGDRFGSEVRQETIRNLLEFFSDRLRVHLRGEGARHDLVAAVFAAGEEDDLVRLVARVTALARFLDGEDGAHLLTGLRRAGNIVEIEEQRDGATVSGDPDPNRYEHPAERALDEALREARAAIAGALSREAYEEVMAALARLRVPIDAFFEAVRVNVPDPALRGNRLRLLAQIRAAMVPVAEVRLIEDRPE